MKRRDFLISSAAATASGVLARHANAQAAQPNAKLNIAVIGCGGYTGDVALDGCKTENIVALCDVNAKQTAGRAAKYPNAKLYHDFRKLLEEMNGQIDAVTISTPDHTHFPIAMAAMKRGKHVFLQKPLAHTVAEARLLMKTAQERKVVTQMGNQAHTSEGIRLMREWVQGGVLGEVREVHCWTDRPMGPWFVKPASIPPAPAAVPDGLDWDLWLGPAEPRPYSAAYQPVTWRGWWDFGNGCLGDMGCHTIDGPFWALDLVPPEKVEVKLNEPANGQFTSFGAVVTFHFPARGAMPPLKMFWYEGDNPVPRPAGLEEDKKLNGSGMYMVGSKASLISYGDKPYNVRLFPETKMQELKATLPPPSIPRVATGPVEEWIRAIKGGPAPGANFDYAGRLSEVVLLGVLAIRTGKTVEWDAANMSVTNNPELNQYIKIKARPGWDFS